MIINSVLINQFNTFTGLIEPTFPSQRLFYANKRISYFFPLRCFLSLMNLMSMNLKLINLMSMNFKLINLMSMNFKLINLMLMNFKLINLMSMNFKLINLKLVVLLVLFSAFQCLVFFVMLFCTCEILSQKKKTKCLKLT